MESILTCILKEVKSLLSSDHKLIAQAYDGVSVMSGAVNGVQAKIKKHFPDAQYIHCYAHQLNLVMEKAASQNQSARVFFCTLYGFPAFLSRSPQRLSALDEVSSRHIPTLSSTRWNFKSRTVSKSKGIPITGRESPRGMWMQGSTYSQPRH